MPNTPTPATPLPSPPHPGGGHPAPVRCGTDAQRIVFLALSRPLEHETLVFLLDRHGRGGVITIVSGTATADSVLTVVECFSLAAQRVPEAAAMVVASVRPGSCILPGDIDRWLEASAIATLHGVQLLEWFVVNESGARCPRDLLGEPERWSFLAAHEA
ncbi:MAG: hypothetical protein Q8M22_18535 [Actinomycetota bacterium]|nr:hypothetical protein [Actinomycetota bacterium]